MISSAYRLCKKIIEEDYSADEWNIYPMHFSDGDNWSTEDTNECIKILKGGIIPYINLFCYGQVDSPYGSGQFIRDLRENFDGEEKIVLSEIPDKDAIYRSIKDFLGTGR
jgi:hypothetical protein